MGNHEELTEKELYYIEKAKEIGAQKGDSKELQDLCRQAFSDYREKIISDKAYGKIYAICVGYAYPR